MSFFLENIRKDIRGVFWWAFGLFLGLSLFSYSGNDPSFSSTGKMEVPIQNYCGYIGSFTADFFYQTMGLMSWVLVFICFHRGWRNFKEINSSYEFLKVAWAIFLMISLTALFSLYFPELKLKDHQISVGGFLGLVVSSGLVDIFNFIGAGIILWTFSLMFWILYTEKSLKDLLLLPFTFILRFEKKTRTFKHFLFSFCLLLFLKAKKIFTLVIKKRKRSPKKHFFVRKGEEKEEKDHLHFYPIEPEHYKPLSEPQSLSSEFSGNESEVESKSESKSKTESDPSLSSSLLLQKKAWSLPPLSLFKSSFFSKKHKVDEREVKEKASLLKEKLKKFNIGGEVLGFHTGPAVTLFEFKPQSDVKISRITELADDLSLALSSESVRIIAPIPGRNVVGIETSNIKRENVLFKDLLFMKNQEKKTMKLPISLGLKADGIPKFVDLRKMPHMMVAGSTGSGKSAFILSALTGLLFSHSPETLRLILIDPKQVDLMSFNSLPHLLMPPVRTPQRALEALKWVLSEMEERYHLMSKVGARNLEAFNDIVSAPDFIDSFQKNALEDNKNYKGPQPYIIVVIEEFSDLMAVDKAPVEKAVVKLAQMARACGIHLILAMQSPRRDVITGLIKTNIPGRISFKVASKLDSRIILDESGAERLLNCGDMLFLAPGLSQPERCHAPWVEEKDIAKLIEFWKKEALSHVLSFPPEYNTYENLKSFQNQNSSNQNKKSEVLR